MNNNKLDKKYGLEAARLAFLGSSQENLSESSVRTLLLNTASQAIYSSIGQSLETLELSHDDWSASQTEDLELCSEGLVSVLKDSLDGRFADTMAESLSLMAQHKWRVPAHLLPALLDRASKLYALRPYVLPVLGNTGRWLAAQEETWYFASEDSLSWEGLQREWASKHSHTRQGILWQARRQDPHLALKLVQSTWASEQNAASNWIIRTFTNNLSLADEAFLESALDNRNIIVRRKAAELLSHLSESQLVTRLSLVADELIQDDLSATIPDELEPIWIRDGMMLRNWKDAHKVKNAQLSDLVAALPLDYWEERFQVPVEDILERIELSDYKDGFIKGFALAAERQVNTIWASIILKKDKLTANSLKLIAYLEEADFLDLHAYFQKEEDAEQLFLKFFNRWTKTWSIETLEAWIKYLSNKEDSFFEDSSRSFLLRTNLKLAARSSAPEAFETLKGFLTQLKYKTVIQAAANEALAILAFRQRMHQASFTSK